MSPVLPTTALQDDIFLCAENIYSHDASTYIVFHANVVGSLLVHQVTSTTAIVNGLQALPVRCCVYAVVSLPQLPYNAQTILSSLPV
ncbi:MAG: hypothetical protein WCL18_04920 [bacterium]